MCGWGWCGYWCGLLFLGPITLPTGVDVSAIGYICCNVPSMGKGGVGEGMVVRREGVRGVLLRLRSRHN